MENIGWIGIGIMGSRMVRHVVAAGHRVSIYARDPMAGARIGLDTAASPAALAATSDVVFTIVSAPADVEAIYFGPQGLLATSRPGAALVDMTTSSPTLARRIAAAAGKLSIYAVDAPVSGGPAGAESATLSIMAGASDESFQRVLPLLRLMGSRIVHHGGPGAGQSAKLANQIAIAGSMVGLVEAYVFARANGLDDERMLETLEAGIIGSPLLRFVWPRLSAGDAEPGFRITHFIKDLSLALDSAHESGVALTGTAMVRELYENAARLGYAEKGTQAVIAALDRTWLDERQRRTEEGRVDG